VDDTRGAPPQIDAREDEEVGRIEAEYQPQPRARGLDAELADSRRKKSATKSRRTRRRSQGAIGAGKQREKLAAQVAERDERIADPGAGQDDREDVPGGRRVDLTLRRPDDALKHPVSSASTRSTENAFNSISRATWTRSSPTRGGNEDALRRCLNRDGSESG